MEVICAGGAVLSLNRSLPDLLLLFVLFVPIVSAQQIEPDRIHWVQVEEFSSYDQDRAEALRTALVADGHFPVCIYQTPSGPTVRVGEFVIYMDAYLLWEDLRERFPNARIRYNSLNEERDAGREWDFSPLRAPAGNHEIFALSGHPLGDLESLHFDHESSAILEGGMRPADRIPASPEVIESQALTLAATAALENDPALGLSNLMLAEVWAMQREFQSVRDLALPVADGSIAATSQDRYDAMWLMARLYHARKWRRTAYRAYREIETVATDPQDRARCLLEQCGLLMELAQSGSGRQIDCRLRAAEILEEFGDSDDSEIRHRCATAALMAAETWYRDRQWSRCIEEMNRFLEEFGDIKREWAMAMLFLGQSHLHLQEHESGIEILLDLYRAPLDPIEDDFPDFDTQSFAGWIAVRQLRRLGRESEAIDLMRDIVERWPNTFAATDLGENLREMDLLREVEQ